MDIVRLQLGRNPNQWFVIGLRKAIEALLIFTAHCLSYTDLKRGVQLWENKQQLCVGRCNPTQRVGTATIPKFYFLITAHPEVFHSSDTMVICILLSHLIFP